VSVSHRIVIVDDDEAIRESIDSLFRSVGLSVAGFGSAEEFLRSPEVRSTCCLILDIQMAGMDGLELQEQLLAAGHDMSIIFLTAHGDDEARAQALAAGARAFLPKPVDGDVLLATVASVLR
jgi:FixJ family two-component response regulator